MPNWTGPVSKPPRAVEQVRIVLVPMGDSIHPPITNRFFRAGALPQVRWSIDFDSRAREASVRRSRPLQFRCRHAVCIERWLADVAQEKVLVLSANRCFWRPEAMCHMSQTGSRRPRQRLGHILVVDQTVYGVPRVQFVGVLQATQCADPRFKARARVAQNGSVRFAHPPQDATRTSGGECPLRSTSDTAGIAAVIPMRIAVRGGIPGDADRVADDSRTAATRAGLVWPTPGALSGSMVTRRYSLRVDELRVLEEAAHLADELATLNARGRLGDGARPTRADGAETPCSKKLLAVSRDEVVRSGPAALVVNVPGGYTARHSRSSPPSRTRKDGPPR